MADSWFVKYTKEYNFNRLKESPPYENTQSLPDIENDPEYVNDVGGNKQKLINQAIEKINQSGIVGEPSVKIYNAKTEIINRIINRSMETTNIVSSSSYVASVPGSSGSGSSGYGSSVSNVSTGDINSDSLELVPEVQGDGNNHQQGFCFAGDDLIVYATVYGTGSSEVCSLYLADANTMKLLDSIKGGLSGHGNSIAYDSKTGEVIFPETGVMKLIPVNKTTKTFDKNNIREQALPEYARNTPSIAYNENKDLFICKENVYTREAFYSNGKPLKKMNFKEPLSNLDYSGATAFGNQVYYFYCDPRDRYAHGNYVVICNLDTGNQEETLYDSTPREGEEISFTRDGTLYICYGYGRANGKRGSVGTSFNKTDYSYINDNNIDKSNVTIGSSATANDIARYNTGGEYDKKSGFAKVVKVFNSHYNARSNILSVTEWLFEALAQNKDTEKMVDITQYLLHKATGNNYGEYGNKEFDYEAYNLDDVGNVTDNANPTLSVTTTTFSREQFIQLTQSYTGALSKGSGTKTFRENAGVIYDVCKKNNINPVLCAAQAWKEQNWDDPNNSSYNFWGIEVYNGQNYGRSYSSMEEAVNNYCKLVNERIKGGNGAEKWSKICSQYNNKFTGRVNGSIYDVFPNWACVKNADKHHSEQATHAALYVDNIMEIAVQIYGEGALTGGTLSGNSNVVQFALQFEGKRASQFNLFNYTSKTGASDVWSQADWCAMFVSFCFDNCGLIPNPLPNSYASCSAGWKLLGSRQRLRGTYIPKPGDIIFFGNNAKDHTGIVIECDGTNVKTIEGNTGSNGHGFNSSSVNRRSHSLNSGKIWGYGAMSD